MTNTIESPANVSLSLDRIPPSPNVSSGFESAMAFAQTILGAAVTVPQTVIPGMSSDYSKLLTQQQQMQKEMMEVSLISNILKSKHEAQMAPVRNIRVG
jgi:hypothetical protein